MTALPARLAVLAACLLAACNPSGGGTRPAPSADAVVASFNFPESRLLAEMYAQALEETGMTVRREFDLGPRELVLPALRQQLVDVVPEYLGTLLTAVDPASGADRADPEAVRAALAGTLAGWGLQLLSPAPAQNQNGLTVTRATAARLGLERTSDLVPVASRLTVGGPPECPERRYCLPGLEEVYSLRFKGFVPLARDVHVRRALEDGVIDVGVLFTTDGILAGDDFVLLADDRGLQPAENVVPLVRSGLPRAGEVAGALDAVSAGLTTENLRFLNWRVAVAGKTTAAEARGWLIRHSLIDRS